MPSKAPANVDMLVWVVVCVLAASAAAQPIALAPTARPQCPQSGVLQGADCELRGRLPPAGLRGVSSGRNMAGGVTVVTPPAAFLVGGEEAAAAPGGAAAARE
jgi:hypothetical protein